MKPACHAATIKACYICKWALYQNVILMCLFIYLANIRSGGCQSDIKMMDSSAAAEVQLYAPDQTLWCDFFQKEALETLTADTITLHLLKPP